MATLKNSLGKSVTVHLGKLPRPAIIGSNVIFAHTVLWPVLCPFSTFLSASWGFLA
jgi:hypothetical protein